MQIRECARGLAALGVLLGLVCVSLCSCSSGKGKADAEKAKGSALTDSIRSTYQTSEISKGVWLIDEHGAVNMFLVLGTRSALLIDTGLGEKGLDAVAASITDLPVTVVNTHGHEDHAGGNRFFDTICAHPGDMDTVARFSPGKKITEVKEGFSFDLGGRSLSVIETPGHTRGSICLLDAANRIIFTGDNNNGHVWLFLYESLPVETYLASLERLMARSGEFDVIYPGHGSPCGLERLTAIAASARAILKGGAATRPYQNYANAVAYGPEDALVAFDPRKLRRP